MELENGLRTDPVLDTVSLIVSAIDDEVRDKEWEESLKQMTLEQLYEESDRVNDWGWNIAGECGDANHVFRDDKQIFPTAICMHTGKICDYLTCPKRWSKKAWKTRIAETVARIMRSEKTSSLTKRKK